MASQFSTPSKGASPGSECSVSAVDDVTVPNPTPLTEALDSEIVDPPPEIDFHAMAKILAPIAESLNEAADEAMYPTPPINTPAIISPATSVVYRYPYARSRGMSTIGDRLARAKIEGHRFVHRDSDMVSTSVRSIHSSIPVEGESDSVSERLSDGGRDRHDSELSFLVFSCFLSKHALSPYCLRLTPHQPSGAHLLHIRRPCRQASCTIQQH